MKRILVVQNHCVGFGGDDVVVANESAMLVAHGHEVSLWAMRNDEAQGLGGQIQTAWRLTHNPHAHEQLAKHIARFRPDVVHCHNLFPRVTLAAYEAAAQARVPVVQTLHDFRSVCCANGFLYRQGQTCDRCVTGSTYWGAWHRCYRGSWLGSLLVARSLDVHRRAGTHRRRVHRFIALSESSRQRFIEAGLPRERLVVKPNFIADPGSPPPAQARDGALFVGRLSPEKGLVTLAEAWKHLSHPLQVLGAGPLEPALRAVSTPWMELRGHCGAAEVTQAMRQSRILVMPSECLEGFPLVIVEAFANGLPVIASRLGAMAEIIDDGVTGLLFSPGRADELAARVAWAMAHPQEMAQMGRAARHRYRERYGAEANYRQLLQIYEEAVAAAAT
ncbi:glycosyltransferase family 4 protein [Eleftheria terrae]|uniref:glycosyltransferase family 4 protein n=1 Tax=Eleftheria terrae TaxID=1597781 RepID=UPI00263B528D|nr:glycosyltransferase family 4 protein [Eleftheria terrae]WKB55316.1 glycosyltransferase family 4 protein [Eleftheria terrae]